MGFGVEISGVSKRYASDGQVLAALEQIDLAVAEGEAVAGPLPERCSGPRIAASGTTMNGLSPIRPQNLGAAGVDRSNGARLGIGCKTKK